MILHIPHSSTDLGDIEYTLSSQELKKELFYSTDWFTDELFTFESTNRLVFNKSRLYIDVERFSDERETMELVGRGIKYTKTFYGELLKIDTSYPITPYLQHHELLRQTILGELDTKNRVHIIDCHSFNDDIALDAPDICIGYNEYNSDAKVISTIKKIFTKHGYTTKENYPYSGSIIPDEFVNNPKIVTIMIEINKKLYMKDEDFTLAKTDRYGNVQAAVRDVLAFIQSLEEYRG